VYFGNSKARAFSHECRKALGESEFRNWNDPKMLHRMAESAAHANPADIPVLTELRAAFETWVIDGDLQLLSTAHNREWLDSWFPASPSWLSLHFAKSVKPADTRSSRAYWHAFVRYCESKELRWLPWRIVLDLALPCIDLTQFKRNHTTLKMPFSVHATTGKITLPLDAAQLATFDPATSLHVRSVTPALLGPAVRVMTAWMDANQYPSVSSPSH
jgi:hypothetical protein